MVTPRNGAGPGKYVLSRSLMATASPRGIAHALFGELRRRGFMTLLQEGEQAIVLQLPAKLERAKAAA